MKYEVYNEAKSTFNNKILILLLLLLFPFIQQRFYGDLPSGVRGIIIFFYKWTPVISASVIYLLAFKFKKAAFHHSYIKWFALFWAIYIVVTIGRNSQYFFGTLRYAYGYFALVLIMSISCVRWRKELLSALSLIYACWIFLNFFLDLIFPDGLYLATFTIGHTSHLLGDDNALIYVMLPGSICIMFNSYFKYNRFSILSIITFIITIFSVTIVWSASAMVSAILYAILLFTYFSLNFRFKDSNLLLFVFFVIIVAIFGLSNAYVQSFIEDGLQKDVTLTGRTILWAYSLDMIIDRPLFGYGGFFEEGRWYLNIDSPFAIEYPCHTPYLQLLIDGGISLFIVFIVIIVKSFRNIQKHSEIKSGKILSAGVACIV